MDEIEEFLRRAAQRRQQQPAQPQPPQQPQQPARPFQQEPLYVEAEEVLDVEIVEPDLASHHLQTTDYSERTSHLAEDISHTDERTETHLHKAFDHRVGSLDDSDDALTGAIEHLDEFSYDQPDGQYENRFVSNLVKLFKSPDSIAQAIVMKEIIDRPNWD